MEKMPNLMRGVDGIAIEGNRPFLVNDTSFAPYNSIGIVRATFPNGKVLSGTGNLVRLTGMNRSAFVLTAAQLLYEPLYGGNATEVQFIQPTVRHPLKDIVTKATRWQFPREYKEVCISSYAHLDLFGERLLLQSVPWDFGLVELSAEIQVTDIPRLSAIMDEELMSMKIQLNGYGYFPGELSHGIGKIETVHSNRVSYLISAPSGTAGAPLLRRGSGDILGIHVRASHEGCNLGVRITPSMKECIESWMRTAMVGITDSQIL